MARMGLLRRFRIWMRGTVWQSEDGKVVLNKNGWVVITDGKSSDAIPLVLCSQELIDRIEADLAITPGR